MSGRMTRIAYQRMIEEDIAWLDRQEPERPNSPANEREHIRMILNSAVEYEYGPPSQESLPEDETAAQQLRRALFNTRAERDALALSLEQAQRELDDEASRADRLSQRSPGDCDYRRASCLRSAHSLTLSPNPS